MNDAIRPSETERVTRESGRTTWIKVLGAIVALPVVPFIAWQIYCHVAYISNFETRCGEELMKAQQKNALFEEIHVVDQHVRSFDRRFARLGYTYAAGQGMGNVFCEVETVRSIRDLSPIRIWGYPK
jgi:hypothetical protein